MGKWLGRLMMILGVSALPAAGSPQTNLSDFWIWFEENQATYFALNSSDAITTQRLFDDLHARLQKIDPDLVFEFGPEIGGKRDFVISAGGIRSAFPAVIALAGAAPKLPQWTIIAFRPRRHPINDIEFKGLKISPDEVFVQVARDDDRVALRVFMQGYSSVERERYGSVGYLLLDEALGEYDVETKVGGIDWQPLGAAPPPHSMKLSELPAFFDSLFPQQPVH